MGKEAMVESFPKRLMLEVCGLCNQSCIFCSNKNRKSNKKVIDYDLATRVIQEAYENGVREISFHAMGEPLICRDLKDYVKQSKMLGYEYIYITTNGALAVPDTINPIVDAGLDSIKFSIAAATREDYQKVQGKDDFSLVIKNLKELSAYRELTGCNLKIIVDFVETIYTKGQFQDLKKLVSEYVDEIWFSNCGSQGGIMENGKLETSSPDIVLCREPFDRIVVSCEGLIYACCVYEDEDDLVYGDANKEQLYSAWLSEKAKNIRRQHVSGKGLNKRCQKCEAKKLFQTY